MGVLELRPGPWKHDRAGDKRMRVLVIEDNRRMAELLRRGLEEESWRVDVALDGPSGERLVGENAYDVVILDWMLPGRDGMSLLRDLRRQGFDTPVLMLTARDEVGDRVAGLDAGADDYLVKPFAFAELLARVRVLVRRDRGASANLVVVGDLEIDLEGKVATRAGRAIDLSAREFAVLECLALNRGRVVSRDRLYEHLYDIDDDRKSNIIDVYVGHLRKKIDRGHERALIHTRRGLGYVLEERE